MPPRTTVSAAFQTDVHGYSRWHSELIRRNGIDSDGLSVASTSPSSSGDVVICYFDGDFGRPRGNPPFSVPNYSRFVITIGPDGVDIVAMGWTDG
ncbi:MAG: hypothetical protein ABIP53_07495, partial [Candidatus Limnocylindrales bacterium]